jgi:ribosomal protein L11 methyltransferase
LRTSKVYNILARAIVDAPFRESLFGNGRQALEEWDLSKGERAYLKKIPYDTFEQMVGRMISHWLVPLKVNDRYVILPEGAGSAYPDGLTPIRLASSFAFGNGAHPTTALTLAALDESIHPGFRVLDLGTGSGILSIAAALNGAGSVLALDINAASAAIAEGNIRRNSAEQIAAARQGSLAEALEVCAESGGFDLVLVNILTPVIISFLEDGLVDVLKPGAVLVTSGIESGEVPMMKQTLRNAGLTCHAEKEKDGWAALISQRPPA